VQRRARSPSHPRALFSRPSSRLLLPNPPPPARPPSLLRPPTAPPRIRRRPTTDPPPDRADMDPPPASESRRRGGGRGVKTRAGKQLGLKRPAAHAPASRQGSPSALLRTSPPPISASDALSPALTPTSTPLLRRPALLPQSSTCPHIHSKEEDGVPFPPIFLSVMESSKA
jgi:hypothetical protein